MDSLSAVFSNVAEVVKKCNNFLYLRCFLRFCENFQHFVLSV